MRWVYPLMPEILRAKYVFGSETKSMGVTGHGALKAWVGEHVDPREQQKINLRHVVGLIDFLCGFCLALPEPELVLKRTEQSRKDEPALDPGPEQLRERFPAQALKGQKTRLP
ncbi:hypothetical protein FGSG_13342 [Fusarium graminearum PH-1]|uniref:hypothetical protein n=1 Tax=Gibberella zeae (strain ATCC MYA-4620 / CBS 123657 / FGSC 9075 / NRRL 31084 / PH-1) TaxID=229533 RepID=UPI00021F1E0A|nr:hypothetical protein FGSG_13342 [Fusarium graminearum PH-1]ESU14781.1 hypothetical protein FGSG_13342 [Fusarium graminearum PH-1]|eukprot:XP_011320206.1 hypothetical protein FGSG_13342 [Fusarium graminearum PH-1]